MVSRRTMAGLYDDRVYCAVGSSQWMYGGSEEEKDSPSCTSARVCRTSQRAGMVAKRMKLGRNGKTLEFLMQVLKNKEVISQF